jgi:acyl-coenzyme A thioesterase PaaI-like protein
VGEHGAVLHSDMKYRSPALTGDATLLDGHVRDLVDGRRVAVVDVVMTNQRGEEMARGTAEVRLPES